MNRVSLAPRVQLAHRVFRVKLAQLARPGLLVLIPLLRAPLARLVRKALPARVLL